MTDEIILISMAARVLGMHPQTLRKYERLGLVRPARTAGSMRVYSRAEIARLRLIKRLVDDLGVNLAGVQQLLSISEVVDRMRPLMMMMMSEETDDDLDREDRRRQLGRELDRISRLLGA
ncbi:MAG: MerR family transcriptional regulator [Vicinamibacterales bacterium]|nr:MerR family transcriptional regulator [Vicinamibacterales bacterium]